VGLFETGLKYRNGAKELINAIRLLRIFVLSIEVKKSQVINRTSLNHLYLELITVLGDIIQLLKTFRIVAYKTVIYLSLTDLALNRGCS
jgi:hypothetical protein